MKSVKLWDNAPGIADDGKMTEEPTITYYKAENKITDAAVVIFPGGGYRVRAEHEGKGYAEFLNSNGIDAFVVDYRVYPNSFPIPLADARRGIRYVRYHADKYSVNPNKIAVMGSSAGGHLAALVSTYTKEIEFENADEIDKMDFRPNYQILAYPVVNFSDLSVCHCGSVQTLTGSKTIEIASGLDPILIADKDTPTAFIWHTSDDSCVNVKNSLLYGAKLRDMGVDFEMHVYPNGIHGLGLAQDNPHVRQWSDSLVNWFKYTGFIEK